MSYLLDMWNERLAPDQEAARWRAYLEYVTSIKGRLGPGASRYATFDGHRNYANRMSPHDSWVEALKIEEPATGARSERRSIRITIELVAAHHDGRIRFTYLDVGSYSFHVPPLFDRPPLSVGHGDWLVDEIGLSERGLVTHEILFSRGSRWHIEASDLEYEWTSLAGSAPRE